MIRIPRSTGAEVLDCCSVCRFSLRSGDDTIAQALALRIPTLIARISFSIPRFQDVF